MRLSPRILLYTDATQFAGVERHILELATALCDLGAAVVIGCPQGTAFADRVAAAHLEMLPIELRGLRGLGAVLKVRRLLRSGRFDIVHVHNGRTMLAASIAVRLAGAGTCLATQHFLHPQHISRKGISGLIYRAAHRWVNRRIHHFIAISSAVRKEMLRRGDAGNEKSTSVILHGVGPCNPKDAREEFGIDQSAPLIICAARLEQEKDIGSLIAAMTRVRVVSPTAQCLIAGEGAEHDSLARQIHESGLHENVRLLGFRPDVLSLINAADVLVLPSVSESFGLVLLEAMALGKPVVATRCGGPEEVVAEGESGLLVEPRNPDAIGDAIITLIGDAELRSRMGENGRSRFLTRFTAERMARETLAAYARAMASHRADEPHVSIETFVAPSGEVGA